MKIKDLKDEDFINYKKPSMYIATAICDWKCCTERGLPVSICQNSKTAKQPTIEYQDVYIVKRYLNNPLTSAVVFCGLEPFMQFDEMYNLIKMFREATQDDIVIYTGYYEDEIKEQINKLMEFKNIIVKFGRYIEHDMSVYDPILGVKLASSNQFAKKIS